MLPVRKNNPWKYYIKESQSSARCVLCQKTYKITKNTSNLSNHLKRMHNDFFCNITNITNGSPSILPQVEPSTSGVKPSMPLKNNLQTLNSQSITGCSFQADFPIAEKSETKEKDITFVDLTVTPYQKKTLRKRSSEVTPGNETKKNKYTEPTIIEIDLIKEEEPIEIETFCKNDRDSKRIIRGEQKSEVIVNTSSSNSHQSLSSQHYRQLLALSDKDVVKNVEPFECSICLTECACGNGVLLKECLHSFCKECLSDTIKYCQDAEVKCPYMNSQYHCDSIIQEREIKALLEKDLYEQFLNRCVSIAENAMKNTFHCKTPDCRGWCIYDENVTCFVCPVCGDPNCINCKAIHRGMNCKEYQEFGADAGVGLLTKKLLDEMVMNGNAMECPTCQIILTKIQGCDWLMCTMCKTEVCWATKRPRRGPNGCNCSQKNRCHPKCMNCH